MTSLSKHQLERIGTAYIAEQLYRAELMLAYPDIDQGIDLIVYDFNSAGFRAVPVQIKAFSGEAFYTSDKYLRIPRLRIVYLWNVGSQDRIRAFGMPYPEAERIVDNHEWSRKNGVYAYTRGSAVLRSALEPFEIDDWRVSIMELTNAEQAGGHQPPTRSESEADR